ncbi:BamA/TamA family outer membrane protein [Floridanema aerugineum]|uniref:BamA/TamA family outer membrane protein n=1 Tax=Floridaenema aerugineum BLCC-F46 TaxID=3153654 RepID=A0ABV4XDE4_9CYAN
MRLSPVLVATVAWVTLGNSNPASGQTTENNWATAIKLLNKSQNAASRKSAQRIASPSVERALGDRGQELGDGEKDTSLIPNPQPPISPSPQPPISPSPHLRAEKVVEEITISELSISPFEVQNTSKAELKQEVQAHINIFPATILPPYQGHYSPKDTKGNLIELPVQQSTFYSLNHISDLPQKLKGLITAQAPPATEAPAIPEPTAPEPAETDTPPAEGQRTQPQTPTQPTAPPPLPTLEQNAPPSIPRTEPKPPAQPTPSSEAEPRVLVAEVLVNGVEGKLQDIVYDAIRTRPGRTTTKSQLQEDINAIFATGYFSRVRAEPTDTPLGVRVTFVVEPNPVLRSVQLESSQVLPKDLVNQTFREQYNEILNFRDLQAGIRQLEQWYRDRGYVLAQVVDTRVSPEGVVTLEVAEGIVEDIQVQFLNREGETVDAEGQPIRGRTRPYIVTRELATKPGTVFNRNEIQRDLQRVFGLGLFDDVKLSLNPGQDPRQVTVQVNVRERNSGSIAAGAGFSSAAGLFGTASYQQQNLFGRNQKVGLEVQLGQREFLFDVRFTDPWIAGDPYRTSYTVNLFRRRSISLIFDGGDRDIDLPNGDTPRILRLGGGVTFTRPLSRNPLADSEWVASLGLQYQNISIRDNDGDLSPRDELGNNLSFSGSGKDDLITVQLGAVRDRRNNPTRTTQGSLFRFGLEQSVPIGEGSILLTRLRGSYSYFIPVRFTNFTPGPQALAFNIQGGTILGDLPPYEAFSLGGVNSVRGYDEGDLGSGRSYFQATAEYRFPVFSIIGGVLFFDFGTDLGTGGDVPGRPAEIRNKPGTGFGYGVGVRIQSPLGPIRIDYGFNEEGDSRFQFGIGERF